MRKEKLLQPKKRSGAKAFEARGTGGKIANFLFLCIIALFMAIPLVLVVGNAFKPMDELFVWPPRLFPQHPTLDNFRNISALMSDSWIPMSKYLVNTVFVTLSSTLLHVIAASMAASSRGFTASRIAFSFSSMFIPPEAILPMANNQAVPGWR